MGLVNHFFSQTDLRMDRCRSESKQSRVWGFPKPWGYPNSWMVYFMGNPKIKWMMTRGTPIFGNPHIDLGDPPVFLANKN